ncbi:MAG: ATP-dependent zinc metalloprotease FtsH [Acidimicrobiia bacterium]
MASSDSKPRSTGEEPEWPGPRHGWRVEGLPDGEPDAPANPSGGGNLFPRGPRFWVILLGLLLLNWFIYTQFAVSEPEPRVRISYTQFREQVDAGNVIEVTSLGSAIQGTFSEPVAPDATTEASTEFATERPSLGDDKVIDVLLAKGVIVNAKSLVRTVPFWQSMLFGFGPTILLVGLFVAMFRRGGAGGLMGMGRSRAKRVDDTAKRATFADVAGIDEATDELVEIVDFLRNPDRYRRLGATIPRGVLLSGPPGTGKTLLARAVAGEAGVPFFSLSASEFVEMIVGVGASRVRDLFAQAKKSAPAIMFIDELDAIGRARGSGANLGGHDEREQTLNQILTEMDGFSGSEGVIVLAATNRPEILDSALLRPGRFDRHIVVNPPDVNGRKAILAVHTRSVPLGPDVDLSGIAAATPGMVGADLRNLVNEAALMAARRGHPVVCQADFTDAFEKVVLGTARSITMSPAERERTAFHESGHAITGILMSPSDPVRKISIIPRGAALGVTFQAPDADRYDYDERYLRGRIVMALGGRAAEQVVYGNVTTGAESDLEKVTMIARQMVGRWGMSDVIGPVAVLPRPGEGPLLPGADATSPRTQELVDGEVRRIIDECYQAALALLVEHRDRLDALAGELLHRETLDEPDIYAVVGFARPTPATAS